MDVLFGTAGHVALEHRTPQRTYTLATFEVAGESACGFLPRCRQRAGRPQIPLSGRRIIPLELRDQVVERYSRLNVPTYWCGINSDLTAKFDSAGKVSSVTLSYPRDYVKQQLGYAAMYGLQ